MILQLTILLVSGVFFLFLSLYLVFLIISIIKGAPFVLSSPEAVEKMVSLVKIKPGEEAADLGSGDGRVIIALAKKGMQVHGYEINPFLVLWSRYRIYRAGLKNKAKVHWKSFWREDLHSFDLVTIYGIDYIMKDLEKKLRKELKSGTRVVSNIFTFPSWSYLQKENDVYLYKKR